jgi:hypothetical protein
MAKEIFIEGGIYHPNGEDIDLNQLNQDFIEFIESKGLVFGGMFSDKDPDFDSGDGAIGTIYD